MQLCTALNSAWLSPFASLAPSLLLPPRWLGALGPITACFVGIVAVVAGGLQNRGIKIVEKIPRGEPS